MADRVVCLCNFVPESEIKAILKKGATSTKNIQSQTGAGTSCGRCLPVIDQMVKEHLEKQKPNPQQKLDL